MYVYICIIYIIDNTDIYKLNLCVCVWCDFFTGTLICCKSCLRSIILLHRYHYCVEPYLWCDY